MTWFTDSHSYSFAGHYRHVHAYDSMKGMIAYVTSVPLHIIKLQASTKQLLSSWIAMKRDADKPYNGMYFASNRHSTDIRTFQSKLCRHSSRCSTQNTSTLNQDNIYTSTVLFVYWIWLRDWPPFIICNRNYLISCLYIWHVMLRGYSENKTPVICKALFFYLKLISK